MELFELAEEITTPTLLKTAQDEQRWWQPKLDGTRGQICIEAGVPRCTTREGHEFRELYGLGRKLAAAVPHLWLDGERLDDGTFIAFDILAGVGEDLRGQPYRKRLAVLQRIGPALGIPIVESAHTPADKYALFERVTQSRGEGLIVRAVERPWTPRRGIGLFKFKFWKTASLGVLAHNQKRSVQLGTAEGTPVGDCAIPNHAPMPTVGSAIELRYLYLSAAGRIYQPTYLRPRLDGTIDAFATLIPKGSDR